MGAQREGAPPPPAPPPAVNGSSAPGLAHGRSLPRSGSEAAVAGRGSGTGSTQPYYTPDALFYVWMEGLPAGLGFNFQREYLEPCNLAFGAAFKPDRCTAVRGPAAAEWRCIVQRRRAVGIDAGRRVLGWARALHSCNLPPACRRLRCCRSFLVDRHDVGSSKPSALTWGVLAFSDAEIGGWGALGGLRLVEAWGRARRFTHGWHSSSSSSPCQPACPHLPLALLPSACRAAQQCGMRVAVGPLITDSQLPHPPHRVTVRRRALPPPSARAAPGYSASRRHRYAPARSRSCPASMRRLSLPHSGPLPSQCVACLAG